MRRSGANGSGGRKMRISAGVLVLLLAVLLFACGGQTKEQTEARSEQVPSEKKTTLMIYMIGSDLESKGGEGEKDFTEIETSGVDRAETNVVVFAGGCKTWHDEKLDKPINRIRVLKEDGFETIERLPADSMGEPDTLAYFINYAVEHFPAEHYALILWDHGGGPVKGYGRDELHGMDGLTLREMREAMEKTPFAGGKRLDWVGFDACMMASAELACVWSPYADYLVASQEIEPSIGWEYSFLGDLNKVDTETLLMRLAERYLEVCRAYFATNTTMSVNKRKATLSVMDLSLAPELDAAIEAMFTAAATDVEAHFDVLAYSRVNTRSLCRTSTGSEYDLIDLGDLALQMQDIYPEETDALRDVIGRMVLCNETNNEGLCGLSLYYPFYNKSYYLVSWGEEYAALGLFPAYQAYLTDYAKIWTDGNMKTEFAFSGTPKQISEDKFTLDLTKDQAAHFASARYYILVRAGEEKYLRVYTGADVIQDRRTLEAKFTGKTILVLNENSGIFTYPIVEEIERVDDNTFYAVHAILSDEERPESERKEPVPVRIVLCVNDDTDALSIVSVQRTETEQPEDGVMAGRQEDVDPYAYTTIVFPMETPRLVTRENDVVQPFESWVGDHSMKLNLKSFRIREGLGLRYDYPYTEGFSIVFEIRDTQNGVYCSEPADCKLGKSEEQGAVMGDWLNTVQENIIGVWFPQNADSRELFSSDGLTLRIRKGERQLLLVLENATEKDVQLELAYVIYNYVENGEYRTSNSTPLFCPAGEVAEMPLNFMAGLLDGETTVQVQNVVFLAIISEAVNGQVLENAWISADEWIESKMAVVFFQEPYTVDNNLKLSLDWLLNQPLRRDISYHGAKADPQIIREDEDLQIELTRFLTMTFPPFDEVVSIIVLKCKNLSDDLIQFDVPYMVVNERMIVGFSDTNLSRLLNRGAVIEVPLLLSPDNSIFASEYIQINSVETLSLAIRLDDGEIRLCPIKLSENRSASGSIAKGELLYEENGVRVSWLGFDRTSGIVYLRIDNDTDQDIALELDDLQIKGEEAGEDSDLGLFLTETGAGQSRICALTLPEHYALEDLSFRLAVLDITRSKVLFRSEKRIDLSAVQ